MTALAGGLYLPMFWSFVPPADVVLNACMEDLGVAKAVLPFHGDGPPWHRGPDELSRNLSGRPPLWHRILTQADFETLHFFHARFAPVDDSSGPCSDKCN